MSSRKLSLIVAAAAILLSPAVHAENILTSLLGGASAKKTSFAPGRDAAAAPAPSEAITDAGALLFTAPPRETPEEGAAIYGPVVEYLSKAIGRKIVYKHPGTWGIYRTEMVKGTYDLVFDGPHFNSYRVEKLNHSVLVKIPVGHEFVAVVKKDERFASVKELAGRTFCAHAPPNLGTLMLLAQFDNPSRQPVILNTSGWDTIYEGVASGRCVGGVLPIANLKKLDKDGRTKIVFKGPVMPNQAFSAGPRLTSDEQAKLAQALLAPEAARPTEKLRAEYKVGERFVAASNQEYAGLSDFLRNEWGYY
jgi:ABC-type phosphate/phosphonate transport system substrate-binding protein